MVQELDPVSERAPCRVQLRRTRGWRMPPGCRKVDRSTRWGNEFQVWRSPSGAWAVRIHGGRLIAWMPDREVAALTSVTLHRAHLLHPDAAREAAGEAGRLYLPIRSAFRLGYTVDDVVAELAGADLGCWCAPGSPCHGDTLLEVANGVTLG